MIIFDLDQTLANTSIVADLRKARQWSAVMSSVPSIEVYPGVHDLIADLDRRKVPLAIVTKSPDMIPKAFIDHHRWPIKNVVGYHQVKNRKPHPEGLLLAIKNAGVADASAVCHVGDLPEDTEAARAAGALSIGAAWGTEDLAGLKESSPDYLFDSIRDLSKFLLKKY